MTAKNGRVDLGDNSLDCRHGKEDILHLCFRGQKIKVEQSVDKLEQEV